MKKRLALRSFRLQNFKAVRDSGTVAFGPLTVFIGNNGSGKSSLVEGLETFRDINCDGVDAAMTRWRGFEHVWNQAVDREMRRPAGQRPYWSAPMTFDARLRLGAASLRVTQAITVGERAGIFIQEERLTESGRTAGKMRSIRSSDGKHTIELGQSGTPQVMAPKLPDGRSLMKQALLDVFVEGWQFLSLAQDAMGQPTPQQRAAGRIRLARNGANLAEYLNDIRERDQTAFRGIVELLQYVLPFAADLEPTLASELQREFYLKVKEEEFEVPGWLLSTGTLRILALVACLRHPDPPPLLVVEEVENGLDPRTISHLVEEIRAAIDEGKTQVILTTHSPYLLDLLDLSQIVVVERVDGQPTFTRPDKKALAKWAKSFAPGKLYTMGRLTPSRGS
jgi:predicted ATPase